MTAARVASCACGDLRVACAGEPVSVSLCHCLECQKRTGSVYGIAAFFTRPSVEVSGACSSFVRASDSGHGVTFHFCPRCGSTVFWEPARKPDFVAVAVGSFADPSFPMPGKSVYQHHRHHWVLEPGAIGHNL
jgi:hypothetical protein